MLPLRVFCWNEPHGGCAYFGYMVLAYYQLLFTFWHVLTAHCCRNVCEETPCEEVWLDDCFLWQLQRNESCLCTQVVLLYSCQNGRGTGLHHTNRHQVNACKVGMFARAWVAWDLVDIAAPVLIHGVPSILGHSLLQPILSGSPFWYQMWNVIDINCHPSGLECMYLSTIC